MIFDNYKALKAAGAITIGVYENSIQVTKKQFNPFNGVEIEPEIISIPSIERIESRKKIIQNEISNLQSQLAAANSALESVQELLTDIEAA